MLLDECPYPLKLHGQDASSFRAIRSVMDDNDYDGKRVPQHQLPFDHYRWDRDELPRTPMNVSSFDKMNTLSLIASAAAANEGTSKFAYQPNSANYSSSFSPFDRIDQMRTTNSFVKTYHDDIDDESSTASDVSSNSTSSAVAPTSNGSRERKAPNNYKKLQSASSDETSFSGGPSSSVGQDKRYTGLSPDQVRCLATTTRGRPCTYTAVQCTKYCFLHADYDTNPPPRRTKSNKSDDKDGSTTCSESLTNSTNMTEANVIKDEIRVPRRSSPSLSVDFSSKKVSKGSAEPAGGFKKRRTNAKFAEKHAESTRPLLSMMATDQWFGQSVEVAVGPFVGQKGTVQKWGNGWITILIDGVGFHNRRSFELYLNSSEADDSNDSDTRIGSSSKKSRMKNKNAEKLVNDQDQHLLRCVSRDVVSPSPPTTLSNVKDSRSNNGIPKVSRSVTPKPGNLLSPRGRKDNISAIKKVKATGSNVDEFPESPLPRSFSDGMETPVPAKTTLDGAASMQSSLMLPAPKVTPFPEKAMSVTRTLSAKDRANEDLQFPTSTDDVTKQSTGIKASESALVFRPSMGERTRGRSTSLGGGRSSDHSSDSVEEIPSISKKRSNNFSEEHFVRSFDH